MKLDNKAQGLLLAGIFVLVAIGLGGLAVWGAFNFNLIALVIGIIGVVAWFFAGRHIL